MKLPAMERLIRSRYATAARINSQDTRNQRTRLSPPLVMHIPSLRRECGHTAVPRIRLLRSREQQSRFDHAACDFKTFTNSRAMIFSSPGCNMKEFMDKASPYSPEERTTDGFPLRKAAVASRGVKAIRAESHLMCMWGTWFAISGAGNEVITPGILVTWPEMKSRRRCHSLFSTS